MIQAVFFMCSMRLTVFLQDLLSDTGAACCKSGAWYSTETSALCMHARGAARVVKFANFYQEAKHGPSVRTAQTA